MDNKTKKVIVFLGASITQGKISCNFVTMLKRMLGTGNFKYINHGIAGFESYNVLQKLDKAISEKPDFVVILVGTNDVLSSLNPELAKVSRKLKKIPHEPTLAFYTQNISEIISRLKKTTASKIAVASLPVIGEDLSSPENHRVFEYTAEIKNVAEKHKIDYLAVNEKQMKYLNKALGGKGKAFHYSTTIALATLFRHFLLFQSLDTISKKNGFLLLTDSVHQNSKGAAIIADEIASFIKKYL